MEHQNAGNAPTAQDLLQLGLAASRDNRVDEALAQFRQAAELAPHSGLPHFLIGAELAQLGRMDEAEVAYANAVLLAPELEMARYQLGLIQFTSGRAALGLVTWGPLFQLPEDNPLHHIVRGFAALAQDDFDAATAGFREGMRLNQGNAALNNDLQMLIDRIAARSQVPPLAADGQAPAESPAGDDAGLHVLLSNYQRQGPLH